MVMNSTGRARLLGWAAALVFVFGIGAAQAQTAGHMRIVTQQGPVDIAIASVVAADLNGDATADREASAPSVSEITVAREHGSGMATGKAENIGSQSSGAGAGKAAAMLRESPTKQSTGQTTVRESPTKQSTGVTAPRDASSGMATGKRMHKPFVITKEIDKASPLLGRLAASGSLIPEMDVYLENGRFKLSNVMVSSIHAVGGSTGGDRPMESISFNYEKIEMK